MIALYCRLSGHKVDRRKVWNDTRDYRTNCRRCGVALLRDIDGWRPYTPADDHPDRLPHPSERD